MKFLHAADIHLDSPLHTFRRMDAAPDLIGCTRRAFSAVIDLAIREDVAFLLIAGDLYDGDGKDFGTGLFFAQEMRRLGRPCFLIRGNHDARSIITGGLHLSLPPNVHVFPDDRCTTETLAELGIALHGRSFWQRAVPANFAASYTEPVAGLLNIGLLHTSATSSEHESYAPCTPQELAQRGYDYWALGHVHARAELHDDPWIVFPGNTQGRSVRECGPKGCTLVHVRDRRVVELEPRPTDVLRWAVVRVDLSGVVNNAAMVGLVREMLEDAVAAADGRILIARIELVGATPLHQRLRTEPNLALTECQIAAEAVGGVLIERAKVATTQPAASGPSAGTLSDLQAFFEAARQDPALAAELAKEVDSLLRQVPQAALDDELRALAAPGGLALLSAEAWETVAAGLT